MQRSTVVLYLRVSTEEQVGNLSLDTQENACRDYAARQGWTVEAAYREEGASAKTLQRPVLQQLLADVGRRGSRVARVLVYRLDRLSREQQDFYALRAALTRHGVAVVSASERIEERSIEAVIVETFAVLQAQVDNMIRSARTRAGMTEAARRGRWVWSPPFGYRVAPREADDRPRGIEPHPDHAPLVKAAFAAVAAGAPIAEAHRALVAGCRAVGRRPLTLGALGYALRHPIYVGRLVSPRLGIDVPSAAPALVDEVTWARVQGRLCQALTPARRRVGPSADFPLRGVLRCACGAQLTAYQARGKSGRRWPYYRCTRCGVHHAATGVEARWESLLARLSLPEAVVALVDRAISRQLEARAAELSGRLSRARARLRTSEQRLERLLALRVDGEIEPEEFAATRTRLAGERDAARAELAEIADPAPTAERASAWLRQALTDPVRLWLGLTPEQRIAFARRVFPEGVPVEPSGEIANPEKSLFCLPLRDSAGLESGLVPPTGFEPVFAP